MLQRGQPFIVGKQARQVKSYLRRQSRDIVRLYREALEEICKGPHDFENPRIAHLKADYQCTYRYRLARGLRIMYEIDQAQCLVKPFWFGPRGSAPYD